VVIFSNCKINLGLNIVAKRNDGFHNLETCFYPVALYDVIELIPAKDFIFTTTGLSIPGDPSTNLCTQAYHLLKNDYPTIPNIHLHLQKNLPMGAGIGGGSANAAHVLQLLNQKFALQLSAAALKKYAAQLGSDCSFFIENKPCIATGRGEVLQPIAVSLAEYTIVLLFTHLHVSTATAFAKVTPKKPVQPISEIVQQPIAYWRNHLVNDFETSVFEEYPILKNTKEQLYQLGALYAAMSGSGSTIYGIFSKDIDIVASLERTLPQLEYKIVN
jgi:4-diphosphocytidyl-2-C-methyl-D-erythritol kinase